VLRRSPPNWRDDHLEDGLLNAEFAQTSSELRCVEWTEQ
jgi:hypothetical protein